jgi:hypothetical protein
LLAFVATPVLAAGLWPDFPIVGGASYCASTSTGVNGQVCTVTVPAGPTALTGAETVPADTNLAQGQPPQTVKVPVTSLASGAYATSAPLTGASVVIPNNVSNYVITPAGTIATLTVTMPSAPTDGQVVHISSSQTVTALTLSGAAGQTVSNSPTAITISTTATYGYAFLYQASSKKWLRLN